MIEALPGTNTQNYTKPGVQIKLDLSLISMRIMRRHSVVVRSSLNHAATLSNVSHVHQIIREPVCKRLRLTHIAGLKSRRRDLDPEVALLGDPR
jgi:hypothetical protein